MAVATLRADGMDWPLQTYLDAMAFRRVDAFDLPSLADQVRITAVTRAGELIQSRYADQVDWHDILAFRPLEHGPESTPCRCCGDPCARLDDDICQPCEDDGDLYS